MLVQFFLATVVLYCVPRLRPKIEESHDSLDERKPLMTRMFYITRIGPCGAATGLDIGLGNMSLKFITLTFYSMSVPEISFTNSSNVQIILSSICARFCLSLPP